MKTLTDDQAMELENKHRYVALKAELLKEYKSYEGNLEFADDEFEENLILEKRNTLAVQIKSLGEKIRDIESFETNA